MYSNYNISTISRLNQIKAIDNKSKTLCFYKVLWE